MSVVTTMHDDFSSALQYYASSPRIFSSDVWTLMARIVWTTALLNCSATKSCTFGESLKVGIDPDKVICNVIGDPRLAWLGLCDAACCVANLAIPSDVRFRNLEPWRSHIFVKFTSGMEAALKVMAWTINCWSYFHPSTNVMRTHVLCRVYQYICSHSVYTHTNKPSFQQWIWIRNPAQPAREGLEGHHQCLC